MNSLNQKKEFQEDFMQVKEIMTPDPVCCSPGSSLVEAARLMVGFDCGEIPVIENRDGKRLIGVVTDRDIVCRCVAQNASARNMTVGECMSTPPISISEDANLDECMRLMEENQIRRLPVVRDDGKVCGIVALADLTKHTSEKYSGQVLRDVSKETESSSDVA
jgi:CBS domain-containing protein